MTFRFIVFEGIDGSGKSQQLALLAKRMRDIDLTPVELFEPTNGQYGALMREHMTKKRVLPIDKQIELFTLDREDHVRTRIKPLLRLMKRHPQFAILQHRYYLSAPAYQASKQEEMTALLRSQQSFAPKPDVVVLLDVSARVALARLRKRQKGLGMFDDEKTLDAVRRRYLSLSTEKSEHVVVIDGTGTSERVSSRVWEALKPSLAHKT